MPLPSALESSFLPLIRRPKEDSTLRDKSGKSEMEVVAQFCGDLSRVVVVEAANGE
jgi:hypothetical protein